MGTSGLRVAVSCSRHLLLLLAVSLSLPTAPSLLSPDGLKCLCDYNNTISCVWDSTRLAQYANITAATSCRLNIIKQTKRRKYPASCNLKPLDPSNPALRACDLIFNINQMFNNLDILNISLVCESVNHRLGKIYKPVKYIKLKPPRRPEVNLTTVSLPPVSIEMDRMYYQLQLKEEHQPWEVAENLNYLGVPLDLETRLVPGSSYQVRSRVQGSIYQSSDKQYNSEWSDWSPVVTFRTEGPDRTVIPGGMQWEALVTTAVGALLILSLAIIICKTDRDTWVYMVKKIRGPPLPNLAEFLHLDGKSQTGFTCESHHTLTRRDIISSVEVTTHWSPPLEKLVVQTSYFNPSYSNPSYSPVLLLHLPALSSSPPSSQGNLEPCSADSPYGPVGEESMGEPEENQGEDRGGRAPWDLLNMISGAHISTAGSMTVCPDYEKVGNVGVRRNSELQSPDPGVGCSEEEERDSQDGCCREGGGSQTDNMSQGSESREEEGEGAQTEKLLSDTAHGAILGQGSLEVYLVYEKVRSLDICLDYEKFRLLEGQKHSALSPDSGVGSGGEEQVSQESMEEVDFPLGTKTFTFPPLSGTELCPRSSFIQTPSFFPGQD